MTVSTDSSLRLDKSFAANTNATWLVGNARLTHLSGQLLGAHIAHAGLIMFWAGITAVSEALRFDPSLSMGEQNFIVLPHLATLGWGVGAGGTIVDVYPYFAIGMLHLVASAVLGAGGLFHVFKGPAVLKDGPQQAAKFHYDWNDAKKLGFILGSHLVMLGLGAFLLVLKAMRFGGIYDAAIQQVRLVTAPTLDPATIWGYLVGSANGSWTSWGMAAVNNLEDVIGGHIWIGTVLILGGLWHMAVAPFPWAKRLLRINADALLSYSLGGLAFMAFVSVPFIVHNTLVFPIEFYGGDRLVAANVQILLGILALGGHLWHAYRARLD